MNSRDKTYQAIIDKKVEKLFSLTPQHLHDLDDFGQESEIAGGKEINVGWSKYQINEDIIHIVYKTSRRTFLFLNKVYINGVKITKGKMEYLTSQEIEEYN